MTIPEPSTEGYWADLGGGYEIYYPGPEEALPIEERVSDQLPQELQFNQGLELTHEVRIMLSKHTLGRIITELGAEEVMEVAKQWMNKNNGQ